MVCNINILSPGFTSANGAAFLYPILLHKKLLRESGYAIRIFRAPSPALKSCDVVIVDSKFHAAEWGQNSDRVLAELASFKDQGAKLIYAETGDSTGWVHVKMLDLVDCYLKNQILKDRTAYLRPHYGLRLFTEYYHHNNDVVDTDDKYSQPISSPDLLEKLAV